MCRSDKITCSWTIARPHSDSATMTGEQLESIITAVMAKSSEQLNEAYSELAELLSSSMDPYLESKSQHTGSDSESMLPTVMQATWVNPTWIHFGLG
jgi:hypothetical protein